MKSIFLACAFVTAFSLAAVADVTLMPNPPPPEMIDAAEWNYNPGLTTTLPQKEMATPAVYHHHKKPKPVLRKVSSVKKNSKHKLQSKKSKRYPASIARHDHHKKNKIRHAKNKHAHKKYARADRYRHGPGGNMRRHLKRT